MSVIRRSAQRRRAEVSDNPPPEGVGSTFVGERVIAPEHAIDE
jgi:hypothetical protein